MGEHVRVALDAPPNDGYLSPCGTTKLLASCSRLLTCTSLPAVELSGKLDQCAATQMSYQMLHAHSLLGRHTHRLGFLPCREAALHGGGGATPAFSCRVGPSLDCALTKIIHCCKSSDIQAGGLSLCR